MRMLPLAGVLVSVVLLAGCVPSDPVVTPQPEPSSTPLFASEEEALAAATEAYAAYLAMSDTIFNEGGAGPERLEAVASGDALTSNLRGYQEVKANGERAVGMTAFDSLKLQRLEDPGGAGASVVVVYLCHDVSGVDVLNSAGESIVSADRPERAVFEVTFESNQDGQLLVAGEEPWPGSC